MVYRGTARAHPSTGAVVAGTSEGVDARPDSARGARCRWLPHFEFCHHHHQTSKRKHLSRFLYYIQTSAPRKVVAPNASASENHVEAPTGHSES